MHQIFEEEETEALLLIDATNTFNALNRKAFLHNVSVVCPAIATYVINCYAVPSRLFVVGGHEITSNEGTTQGDPIAMAVYATATIPLMFIEILNELPDSQAKTSAFADDFSAAGSIRNLMQWWKILCDLGPKFGYFPEPSKSWIIIKPGLLEKAVSEFQGTGVKITEDGKRHLGAVIGTEDYREEYMTKKINQWSAEIEVLCRIANIEPQAAHSCFISGYKNRLSYYMRTIPNIGYLLERIDNIITTKLIPAITGGKQVSVMERRLISLPQKYGGLGIPIFSEIAEHEYQNSLYITEKLRDNIIQQKRRFEGDPDITKKKNAIKAEKHARHKEVLNEIRNQMTPQQQKLNDINQVAGASMWLTTLPIKDEGYVLNKQCYWDLLHLRYGWDLTRLPASCECGTNFTIDHALSCKKGGFISLRHNKIRNITASLLRETCRDVRIEPCLQHLTGETFEERTAVMTDEARVDVSARGFWTTGQTAFLDIRVFNPMAKRYVHKNLNKAFETNEKEKKRKYCERVMDVEHGSFTPIVMSALGGMGRESTKFFARLSEMISEKRHQPYSLVSAWIRRKLSFAIINSVCVCIRGSRSLVYDTNLEKSIEKDPRFSEDSSKI